MDEQTKGTKNGFYGVMSLFFLVLTMLLIYSVFWGPIKNYQNSLWPVRTTSVSAEGKAVVEPDIANFAFSVVSEGVDPEKLADQNNQKITEAINFVKEQGIEDKDIKTTGYNLNPKYNYDRYTGVSYLYGYTLTQTVSVKVRDLKNNLNKIPKILGGLPEMGINQVGSISFSVDDPQSHLAEAKAQAFEKARKKAEENAKNNGLQLGRILNVNEYGGQIPMAYGLGGGYGGAYAADEAMKSVAAPTIEPGSQELTISVNITYELK